MVKKPTKKDTAAVPAPDHKPTRAEIVASVNKELGEEAVMLMSGPVKPIPVLSTGLASLDRALGVGGLPRGRVIEIYGPESSGKTTLATQLVARTQADGGICAYVDAEHALDPTYVTALGAKFNDLLLSQPNTGEQGLEIVRLLCKAGGVDLIVVDSVAALTPKAEIEGEVGDSAIGAQARMMSQALRMITPAMGATGTTVVFINQIRNKIGVLYGSPEVTTGGKALPFYASVRIDVRRREAQKVGTDVVGHEVELKTPKNKVAPPFRSCKVKSMFGQGFQLAESLIREAEINDVIKKSGSFYIFDGQTLGQGMANAAQALVDDPQLYAAIEKQWRRTMGWPDADQVLPLEPDPELEQVPAGLDEGPDEIPVVGAEALIEQTMAASESAADEPVAEVATEATEATTGATSAPDPVDDPPALDLDPGVGMEDEEPPTPATPASSISSSAGSAGPPTAAERISSMMESAPQQNYKVAEISRELGVSAARVRKVCDQMVERGVLVLADESPRSYRWAGKAA
jgi:recombination protein RecA